MAHDIWAQKNFEALFAPEDSVKIFGKALLTCLDNNVPIFNLERSLSEV